MSAPRGSRRLAERWEGFWHAQASPAALALFRLLFAYLLWREIKTTYGRSVAALAGPQFHLPYASFIGPVEWDMYELLHGLQYPLIAMFALGVLPRLSSAALLGCQGWIFFADQLTFRNHPYFFMLVILIMLPSPAWEALSVKALLRGFRRREPWETRILGPPSSLAFQRLIQVQVCLVYLYSAMHKVHGLYLDGGVLQRILTAHLLESDSGRFLRQLYTDETLREFLARPELWTWLSPTVILLEIGLPIFLWRRRWRPLAVVVGIGFHLTIMLTMSIHVFSYAMIAAYLLFLDPETIPRLARRAWRFAERGRGKEPEPAGPVTA